MLIVQALSSGYWRVRLAKILILDYQYKQ